MICIFKILKRGPGHARTGEITTAHGKIKTPFFVPVATKATVKALTPAQLTEIGAQATLANTYHLHLRPGECIVHKMGGLHKFMAWDKPIITDSGGFQVFSLGFGMEHQVSKIGNIFPDEAEEKKTKDNSEKLAKVDDEGVTFKSPIDGKMDRLTPEISIKIQEMLGADIILAFDECTSPLSDYEYTKKAMHRTHRWAEQCIHAHKTSQLLFGIIQGGEYRDLREESAKFISSLDFPGLAIGGSLGKSKKDMYNILEWCIPHLPEDKPRHLLGIGSIDDLFECVERGIDMFDCVMPTRLARAGYLLLSPEAGGNPKNKFRTSVKRSQYRKDPKCVDKTCDCYACRNFSMSYLRHLFRSRELLFYSLASIHNLSLVLSLMQSIRDAIKDDEFFHLKKKWLTI